EFSARNGGKIWFGALFSIATTLPMLGAISPRAAAGFRPICVQRCASECTSAQACIDRTRHILGSCFESPGKRPVGQLMPLIMVGLKFEGVVPFRTLRSNVST